MTLKKQIKEAFTIHGEELLFDVLILIPFLIGVVFGLMLRK